MSAIRRTYSSRSRCSLPSSPLSSPPKRKSHDDENINGPPRKKRVVSAPLTRFNFPGQSDPAKFKMKSKANVKAKLKPKQSTPTQKALTQLHFSLETSVLRTCPSCGLSYTKGAPDDESLHRAHCIRVQRGMEWGREEQKEVEKANVEEVDRKVVLSDGTKGRIICFRADAGGKIGSKLSILLETTNLTLSAPPLTPEVLKASKAYLFLSHGKGSISREKIVGCAIAQRISTAMAVASPETSSKPPSDLIAVDPSTSLFVHPEPLPTHMGIPRLFVPTTHRRLGIASNLLHAAARTFIRGCPLDPTKGEVAFTQPTGAGAGVMRAWSKGQARIYEE